MDYGQVLLKILFGTLILMVYTRVGGRSQITPLSATDVVSSIVVGSLVSESLFEDSVPAWAVAGAVALWCLAFMGVRYLKSKKIKAELLLDGKSVLLVRDGQLITKSFGAANLTLRDFETLIHQNDIASIQELEEVWFEPTGELAITKKGEEKPSVLLIENGQVYKDNLKRIKKDGNWLQGELQQQSYRLDEVFCAEWHDGKLWVYPYTDTPSIHA